MGSMRSRDRRSLAWVLGWELSAWCARNNVQGAPRLRLPAPGAGWPAAACGGSDTAGRGSRPPLVWIGVQQGAIGPASSGLAWPAQGVRLEVRPTASISDQGWGAGRRLCDGQLGPHYLFCGEGLSIGPADCGPYRRVLAGGFCRRRPKPWVWPVPGTIGQERRHTTGIGEQTRHRIRP